SNFYLPNLDNLIVGEETLNAFDVDRIDLIALLWQTGYLTFEKAEYFESGIEYTMKIPNLEVRNSLNQLFLTYLTKTVKDLPRKSEFWKILDSNNIEALENLFRSLFAGIPYNNYVNNLIANYEGYYASIIYTFLSALGFDTVAEDVSNKGRIDLTLKTRNSIYIFEFKVDKKEEPIKQIKERKYYEKYQSENTEIFMVGINFDTGLKNISNFKWEKV
ncbi:MAG: hypothetical protein DRP58_01375, partial [Spirochaetes bacterium]